MQYICSGIVLLLLFEKYGRSVVLNSLRGISSLSRLTALVSK